MLSKYEIQSKSNLRSDTKMGKKNSHHCKFRWNEIVSLFFVCLENRKVFVMAEDDGDGSESSVVYASETWFSKSMRQSVSKFKSILHFKYE